VNEVKSGVIVSFFSCLNGHVKEPGVKGQKGEGGACERFVCNCN